MHDWHKSVLLQNLWLIRVLEMALDWVKFKLINNSILVNSIFFIVDSQTLPANFDKILPDAYNEVKNDLFRGNFLAVAGRKESDKALLSLVEKHFERGNYHSYINNNYA